MVVLLISSMKLLQGPNNPQAMLLCWHESENKNTLLHALYSFLLPSSVQVMSNAPMPIRTENSASRHCHPPAALTKYSLTLKEELFSLAYFNSPFFLSNDAVNSFTVFITGIVYPEPCLLGTVIYI